MAESACSAAFSASPNSSNFSSFLFLSGPLSSVHSPAHHWLHSLIHPFHGTFCLRLSLQDTQKNRNSWGTILKDMASYLSPSLTGSFIQKGHNLYRCCVAKSVCVRRRETRKKIIIKTATRGKINLNSECLSLRRHRKRHKRKNEQSSVSIGEKCSKNKCIQRKEKRKKLKEETRARDHKKKDIKKTQTEGRLLQEQARRQDTASHTRHNNSLEIVVLGRKKHQQEDW